MSGLTTVVKTTNACNMQCEYCYAESGAYRGRMSHETLNNLLQSLSHHNGKGQKIPILWHGGEPLAAGFDFFQQIAHTQNRLKGEGYDFENQIQTNGTLVNKDFAEYFRENNFSVGLSIDGPKEINDLTRNYIGGASAYNDIMNSIELLKSNGIDANVIVTLSSKNVSHIGEIYEFLKSNRLNARFNPLVKSGRAVKSYDQLAITPKEYLNAKKELLELWYSDPDAIGLFCLEDMFKNLLSNNSIHECSFSKSCQTGFIGVSHNGDVYPCPEFDGELQFRYGNINSNSIEEILSSPIRKILLRREEHLSECKSCPQQKFCNGGCMRNAFAFTGNIMDRDPYCHSYQGLFGTLTQKIIENCKEVE